jgi:energy-coupling factor transporter transmembrane protein EcfT
MSSKRTFTLNDVKNTGIILVVMGLIFFGTGIRTNFLPSPINFISISALLMNLTGATLLGVYYYKTDRKQLTMRLYLAAGMLAMLLVYYFAIRHV